MRTLLVLIGVAALILVGLMSLGFVSLDQTRTAALPTVKLEGGQTPKFDVDVGKVDVGTVNRTVEVPAISVERPGNMQ